MEQEGFLHKEDKGLVVVTGVRQYICIHQDRLCVCVYVCVHAHFCGISKSQWLKSP